MAERDITPVSGVGVGLRHEHLATILDAQPDVPWFELLIDNWLSPGGLNHHALMGLAERYNLAFHGVNLNLGGVDPLDMSYLGLIRDGLSRCQAAHYSEHLCFSRYQRDYLMDLCPLPYTEANARHVADRIQQVQAFLGERILIENVSSYFTYRDSVLEEAEFLAEIAQRADCLILLDINNLYVNAFNHGVCMDRYLATLPIERVAEMHLSGHVRKPGYLLDTHSTPVCDDVWDGYDAALARFGQVPTLIEWDHDLPPWATLEAERQKAAVRWA